MEATVLKVTPESGTAPQTTASPGWAAPGDALRARRDMARAQSVPADFLLASSGMTSALQDARRLAGIAGAPVLMQGERGTGLLELARFIHEEDASTRGGQFRMVAGRLLGQPSPLAKLRAGTLFIEDLETLTPVGQEWLTNRLTARDADDHRLRIVASSQLGVAELLQSGSLGQELILMLDVGRIVVPPLRERAGDVMELARRFLRHCAKAQGRLGLRFSREAQAALEAHSYPGNVRELRNVIERAVALEPTDEIQRAAIVFHEELHEQSPRRRTAAQAAARQMFDRRDQSRLPSLFEVEREYLVMLIRELRGNRVDISRCMGVSYPTVLKKIALHGLTVRSILETDAQ